jgi:hypothetical protein
MSNLCLVFLDNLHFSVHALVPDTFQFLKGAICLARSFKIINESLTSLDLGFNEIRVSEHSVPVSSY